MKRYVNSDGKFVSTPEDVYEVEDGFNGKVLTDWTVRIYDAEDYVCGIQSFQSEPTEGQIFALLIKYKGAYADKHISYSAEYES